MLFRSDVKALAVFVAIVAKAKVSAGNEQQQVEEPESEFVRARDDGSSGPGTRYGSFPGGFIVT